MLKEVVKFKIMSAHKNLAEALVLSIILVFVPHGNLLIISFTSSTERHKFRISADISPFENVFGGSFPMFSLSVSSVILFLLLISGG